MEFDSLADVISFGIAPAILSFSWGLQPLGRLGWAAGFMFVAAAAMRLARFNIQSGGGGDKRYFVGMPSPAAAAIPAATVFAYPWGLYDYRAALPALAMVLVPAALMVSTIRFRSFKTIDLQSRRPYSVLMFIALAIMLVDGSTATCSSSMPTPISRRRSSAWRLRAGSTAAAAAAADGTLSRADRQALTRGHGEHRGHGLLI